MRECSPEANGVPVCVQGLEVLLIVDALSASRTHRQAPTSCSTQQKHSHESEGETVWGQGQTQANTEHMTHTVTRDTCTNASSARTDSHVPFPLQVRNYSQMSCFWTMWGKENTARLSCDWQQISASVSKCNDSDRLFNYNSLCKGEPGCNCNYH